MINTLRIAGEADEGPGWFNLILNGPKYALAFLGR